MSKQSTPAKPPHLLATLCKILRLATSFSHISIHSLSQPHYQPHHTSQSHQQTYFSCPTENYTIPLIFLTTSLSHLATDSHSLTHHSHTIITRQATPCLSHLPDHIPSCHMFLSTPFQYQPENHTSKSLSGHTTPVFHLVCHSGHISKPHVNQTRPDTFLVFPSTTS